MSENRNLIIVFLAIIFVICGFIFVPKIINKLSNKIYKKMDRNEIDYDNLGPTIVKKEKENE